MRMFVSPRSYSRGTKFACSPPENVLSTREQGGIQGPGRSWWAAPGPGNPHAAAGASWHHAACCGSVHQVPRTFLGHRQPRSPCVHGAGCWHGHSSTEEHWPRRGGPAGLDGGAAALSWRLLHAKHKAWPRGSSSEMKTAFQSNKTFHSTWDHIFSPFIFGSVNCYRALSIKA